MNGYEYYGRDYISELHSSLMSSLEKAYLTKLNSTQGRYGSSIKISASQEHQRDLTKELSILKDPIKYGVALDYIQRMDRSYLCRLMEHMRNNNLVKHAADICHKADLTVLMLSIELEQVPLFINSHLPKIRAIAEWRLEIGK